MMSSTGQRPAILMYHRIAEVAIDPWGLAVTPQRFAEQLEFIRAFREPLPMSDFIALLEDGSLPSNAIGITFDDGYVDNFRIAKPLLERAGVPATIFISSGTVGSAREYWWDELARLILDYSIECECSITISGEVIPLTLHASKQQALEFAHWDDWQNPRSDREMLYIDLWKRLLALPHAEREMQMSKLREVFSDLPPNPNDLPMTPQHVRELAKSDVVRVGAHSVTHPVLSELTSKEQAIEIGVSKRHCEELASYEIEGFAYPHGAFDEGTKSIVARAGFRFACSTWAQFVDADCFDRFALPRLQVLNWERDDFQRALQPEL